MAPSTNTNVRSKKNINLWHASIGALVNLWHASIGALLTRAHLYHEKLCDWGFCKQSKYLLEKLFSVFSYRNTNYDFFFFFFWVLLS